MKERRVAVDHSSLNRWVLKFTLQPEKAFRQRKYSVGSSWRMDETYIRCAGFEAVGMADFIEPDSFAMKMGALDPATVKQLEEILLAKNLNALVEVRNPIDINPGGDDEAHLQIVEAFLQDAEIDAVVVGLDTTAPSVRALEQSKLRPDFDITDLKSTVHLMPPLVDRNDKPVIGIVDGGHLYDTRCAPG